MPRFKKRGGSVEYWIEAIRAASDIGRDTAYLMSDIWKRLIDDVEKRLNSIIPLGGVYMLDLTGDTVASKSYQEGKNKYFYGIDSSRTKPVRVGLKFVAFISGTSVRSSLSLNERVKPIYMKVIPRPVPDAADLASYKLELETDMFNLEVEALSSTTSHIEREGLFTHSVVVLDGPLVDPPSLLGRARKHEMLDEKAESFIKNRAYNLATLYKNGVPVIGFVKKLRGSIFLEEYIGKDAEKYTPHAGDRILAFVIANAIVNNARNYGLCTPERPIVVITKPVPLREDKAPDVTLYNEELEKIIGSRTKVYTSLYVPVYCKGNRKIATRIEFVSSEGSEEIDAVRVASHLEASIVPGVYWPLPVLLAHRACTIKRKEGWKLLREVMSKHAVETLIQNVPSLLELFVD
ncbi:MAG: DNA double-strand break repair nuclease NurA [Desulfurococcales archaeon]|nr:DNA double-strand break repair nuclease NurA [Desulfurococcales archaeon]